MNAGMCHRMRAAVVQVLDLCPHEVSSPTHSLSAADPIPMLRTALTGRGGALGLMTPVNWNRQKHSSRFGHVCASTTERRVWFGGHRPSYHCNYLQRRIRLRARPCHAITRLCCSNSRASIKLKNETGHHRGYPQTPPTPRCTRSDEDSNASYNACLP